MNVLLLDFEYFIEKMLGLSTRVWVSIPSVPKLLPKVQTFGAKKCNHVGTLESFHLWTLGTSVKAKRSDSRSPLIKLLDFFHLPTDGHSVKIL